MNGLGNSHSYISSNVIIVKVCFHVSGEDVLLLYVLCLNKVWLNSEFVGKPRIVSVINYKELKRNENTSLICSLNMLLVYYEDVHCGTC